MKQFNNAKITLFDSANAQFKLHIEGVFTRKDMRGIYQPLVYITDQGNAVLNSNIYLVFTFKRGGEERDPSIYMSYPQLFKIREALEKIKNLVADESGFAKGPNGELCVHPVHTDPVIVSNIGKKNKWISLKLVTIENIEEGVSTIIPAVSLELSDADGVQCVLTTEEFLTIYTIIHDINLTDIQMQMNFAFLNASPVTNAIKTGNNPYYAPQFSNQQVPQYQQQYQQPQTGFGVPPQQYQQQPYQYSSYNNRPQQQPQQRNNNSYRVVKEAQNSQPTQQQSDTMKPRQQSSSPIMNLSAVEQTPISTIDYDDSAEIAKIFDEE